MGSNGDIESLARMLGCTPSSIERIRNGQTQAADEFEKRIKDVSIYYAQNNQSYWKLRKAIDPEWKWFNSILHWPYHWSFWVVNVIIILLLAFATLIAIWPLLAEILLFLILWICTLCFSPDAIEDKYVDSINPVVEQIL